MSRNERLFYHEDLAEAGIRLSRKRLFELRQQGQFPEPLVIGERRLAWKQSDLDRNYLASRPRANARSDSCCRQRRASDNEGPGGLRVFRAGA